MDRLQIAGLILVAAGLIMLLLLQAKLPGIVSVGVGAVLMIPVGSFRKQPNTSESPFRGGMPPL